MPQFLLFFIALFFIHVEAEANRPQPAETCVEFANPSECQEAVKWLEHILDTQTKIVTKENFTEEKRLAVKVLFLDKHYITAANPDTTLDLLLSKEQIAKLADDSEENRSFLHLMVQLHMADDVFSLLERVNKAVREELREALHRTAEHNMDIKEIIGLSREELEKIVSGPLTYKIGDVKKVLQNGKEFHVAKILFFPVLAQKLIENKLEISSLGIESPEDYWVQYVMVKTNNIIKLQDLLVANVMLYGSELESIRSIARNGDTFSEINATLAQKVKLSKEEFEKFVTAVENSRPTAMRSRSQKERLVKLYQSYREQNNTVEATGPQN